MFQSIADQISTELSGQRAKHHVAEIQRTDRFSSFDLYRQTARYCLEQMQALGLEGVEAVPCRADGRTPYGDWLVPRAWDAREAILQVAGTGHVLARYPDVPAALAMYSAPTPPQGIETDLILVDDLGQIPADFKGQAIFYDGQVSKAERKALAERGILGLVFGRGTIEHPDLRRWDNYTLAPRNEEGMFGFSLSAREAEYLQRLCRQGPVRIYARVDTSLYDGTVDNVTGHIAGTEGDEEVLALAHIYEQGANDNASGAAISLEVFRTLQRLIERGELARPRRTMRVLLGFECCGFMAYVMARPERMRRTVAAINPDMVGEDQELCGSSFALHLTPGAAPSCVDALAVRLMEDLVARRDVLFRWRKAPYTIGDSFIGDPTIGVPSVSIIGLPDRFYHSSLDTPDKVSPATLEQTGLVLAVYLYFLASAGPREAAWLAEEAAAQARAEIAAVAGEYVRRLQGEAPEVVLGEAAGRLPFLGQRHERAVASALRFGDDARVRAKVERLKGDLEAAAAAALQRVQAAAAETAGRAVEVARPELGELEARASRMVPRRCVAGPLTLEPLLLQAEGPLPWQQRWPPWWAAPHNDALLWADGKRSVLEIWRCTQWESGRRGADLAEIVDYFAFLAAHGYVEIEEPPPAGA
jgi:hypothetical protein